MDPETCPNPHAGNPSSGSDNFSVVRRAVRSALSEQEPGALILVAVSGGADSLAASAALAAEAVIAGMRAGAVTVDHGLQEGSAERAARVARICGRLGLDPVIVERVVVGGVGGPEAAAREARYQALDAVADRLDAAAVFVGHTLDDQAETVLLGLARGSGARSLAGMPAAREKIRRPLLGIRRDVTHGACVELGLEIWDDPHNVDAAYARARVRADVLPALEAAIGPGVAEALARSADLLRDDADALDDMAAAALDQPDPLTVATLASYPAAVRTRVIRLAAIAFGSPAGSLTAAHVRDVDRLVTDWHGQGAVSLPGGLEASRRYDKLRFDDRAAAADGLRIRTTGGHASRRRGGAGLPAGDLRQGP